MFYCLGNNNIVAKSLVLMKYEQYFLFSTKLLVLLLFVEICISITKILGTYIFMIFLGFYKCMRKTYRMSRSCIIFWSFFTGHKKLYD